jgi:hypothetical protein
MALSAPAQAIIDQLTEPGTDPDEVVALMVPYGLPPAERKLQLDHFGQVVTELRAAGWAIEVTTSRKPDGEALAIGLRRAPE